MAEGKILTVIDIRVTIRTSETVTEGSYVPTNDEAAEWAEQAFRAAGFDNVNASAEKVG